ncbi:DUF664 domain-containing protein [Micromonospora sp. NPDC047548]|uniref:mycothiol transferase n=1 Tax=Micromonospora sp. NPDC047548 TaxID=3155624 RepID=UPI0033E644FE
MTTTQSGRWTPCRRSRCGGRTGRRRRTPAESSPGCRCRGARRPVPRGRAAPSLGRILFHLLQEYARHVGQLNVARQLLDGVTGE